MLCSAKEGFTNDLHISGATRLHILACLSGKCGKGIQMLTYAGMCLLRRMDILSGKTILSKAFFSLLENGVI